MKLLEIVISLSVLGHKVGGEIASCGWRCGSECIDKSWICDGYEQCDDNSDEGKSPGDGCNLFPDSGCPSYKGVRHYKCERTGECFERESDARKCEVTTGPPTRQCEGDLWKCKDGRCIERRQVCDGTEHCEDGSDESLLEYDGCNRFPNDTDACPSWGGDRYIHCPALADICVTPDVAVTANRSDPDTCRTCLDPTEWRCNNGLCINATLYRNGVPDCLDGSDEVELDLRWYIILISTLLIVFFGICLSLACRALNRKNTKTFFHCNFCSSSKRRKVERYNSISKGNNIGDNVDCGSGDDDVDLLYPSDDIPIELITLLDDKVNNWEIKKRDSVVAMIHGATYSPVTLKPPIILEAKRLYVLIHNDPVQYHHLYMYLANRCATVKELAKVTSHLLAWEKEMHGMNKLEVIKCWRLHLGSSALTGMVINSVADEPSLASRCTTTFYPFRQFIRAFRRRLLQVKPKEDSKFYNIATISYSTLLPFIEASFFYIEKIKNILYVHIFLTALLDLSHNNPLDHPFEFSLVLFMSIAIGATHFLYLCYSFFFAEDIFEVGHEKSCEHSTPKIILFKILALVLSPIMPCIVLANHVYYDSKLSITRRHLQTHNDSADIEQKDVEDSVKQISQNEKIELYKNICRLETKSLLYRKLYSYYRVTSAVLESVTVIVVLVLLLFVTNRRNRSIKLIIGVEHRLYTFFGISAGGSLLAELNLVRDVVVLGSILYSLMIVLTALVKYWYQAKNLAISGSGQVVLGLYLCFLTINRLTTAISLFATTQPLNFDDGTKIPKISLPVGVFIFMLILLLRFCLVYFYKRQFSRGWKSGSMVDQWINVLINTLVVIPFMVQSESIRVLKEIEKKFSFSPEKNKEKRDSLKRKTSLLRLVSEVDKKGGQNQVVESVAGLVMPNMNFFVAPLLYDDFRAEIRKMWWDDPTKKLDVETVRRKLYENRGMSILLNTMKKEDVDQNIQITLEHLEYIGMVNSPLLNPTQTKREYFWLFLFVVIENFIALGIELVNGGVWTSQGHYYSWDIRFGTLAMSLVFLLAYYKKYHMTRDLTSNPVCGGWLHYLPVCLCCTPDTALAAPPNEVS